MTKSKRYVIRIAGGIALLFLLLYGIAFTVISLRKENLRATAITQLGKQVRGRIEIGDLSASLFRTFPNISVRLDDVTIRDSLWDVHQHDFFSAKKIYIRLQFLSLVRGKPKIGKVIVEDASIYLFTDECGYCNLNKPENVSFSKGKADIPEFTFFNTRLVSENNFLNSYHDIEAKYLDCALKLHDTIYDMDIEMESLVHGLGFNLAKGSYLKEKEFDGEFHLALDPGNKIGIDHIKVNIDQQPFIIDGNIFLHTDPVYYELTISTENVQYKKGAGLLTEALQRKVDSVDIVQPIKVAVDIAGVMAYKAKPVINVAFNVDDADMTTPFGSMTHCSFNGSFVNQVDSLELTGDENSKFTFENVNAEWAGIAITSPLIEVENLLNPFLKCHVQSQFALKDLNSLAESSTISLIKGNGILDLDYNGTISNIDTLYPSITGSFLLTDADFKYIPRDLLFQNCNGSIIFKDEDVIINDFTATAGKTELKMSGQMINLMALLYDELAQPLMEWNISTPELDLNDFISYVRPRAQLVLVNKPKKNRMMKMVENIDRFLHDGTAQLNIKADRMFYKNFVATNVAASVKLVENKVLFDDVVLNHAGGKASIKGSLINGDRANQLTLFTSIDHVNIPVLFQSFDNFGQDAITSKNMKGTMSATINMTGVITDKATVAENTMKGIVDFSITDGELINFEPAVKIAATAFKKRDFSDILFGELKNRLSINGSAIGIEKMEIRSNVVVLFAEGVYDTKKGTDMSIQVPLSNLSKAENELINTGKVGVNVRLRAKTGDDGKLNVTWDPFNNASKERKAVAKNDAEDEKADNRR